MKEQPPVSCPYETFRHIRIALIVNLEATVGHRPSPSSFYYPSARKNLEGVRVNSFDHLGCNMMSAAVRQERLLEPTVHPQLLQPARLGPGGVEDGDPAHVVRGRRDDDCDRQNQAKSVDKPEHLSPRYFLSRVISPGRRADHARATYASRINDPGRWFGFMSFGLSNHGVTSQVWSRGAREYPPLWVRGGVERRCGPESC